MALEATVSNQDGPDFEENRHTVRVNTEGRAHTAYFRVDDEDVHRDPHKVYDTLYAMVDAVTAANR